MVTSEIPPGCDGGKHYRVCGEIQKGLTLRKAAAYSAGVIVRRICSISIIVALLCTLLPGQAPQGCHRSSAPKMCPRTASMAHHCETMQEQDQEQEPEGDASNITAFEREQKCPMNCCLQWKSGNLAANLVRQIDSVELSIEYRSDFLQPVFARTGFSSHTDRGPPLA